MNNGRLIRNCIYKQPHVLARKIPHCWLVDAKNGQKVSTLDIVGNGKLTLVTGLSGTAWKQAAEKLDLSYLNVVTIGQEVKDVYGIWAKNFPQKL